MYNLLTIKSWDPSKGIVEFKEVEGKVAMKFEVHAYFAANNKKIRPGQMVKGTLGVIKKPFVQQLIEYGANPDIISSLPSVLPPDPEGPYHDGLRLETARLVNVTEV